MFVLRQPDLANGTQTENLLSVIGVRDQRRWFVRMETGFVCPEGHFKMSSFLLDEPRFCTLVKKQSSLVGISSRRERLRGSRELFSGTRPSGPLVVESRLSVLVGPQTLWEKKLPLSLARSPTQGHYSREIRGYASTPEPRQQLPPVLSVLVNSQDPMLLIAPRKRWK